MKSFFSSGPKSYAYELEHSDGSVSWETHWKGTTFITAGIKILYTVLHTHTHTFSGFKLNTQTFSQLPPEKLFEAIKNDYQKAQVKVQTTRLRRCRTSGTITTRQEERLWKVNIHKRVLDPAHPNLMYRNLLKHIVGIKYNVCFLAACIHLATLKVKWPTILLQQ